MDRSGLKSLQRLSSILLLIALGALPGFFIGRGEISLSRASTPSDSSFHHASQTGQRAHGTPSDASGYRPSRPKREVSQQLREGTGLSAALLEKYGSTFEKILREKEQDATRDFLILTAGKDPEGVIAAISGNPTLQGDIGLLLSIANGLALQNPASALDFITSQEGKLSSQSLDALLLSAMTPIAKADPAYAATFITKISDPQAADQAMVALSDAWVSKDPQGALKWLEKVIDTASSSTTVDLCYEKILLGNMAHDPSLVAQTVSRIQSKHLLDRLVPQVAAKLASKDLQGAISWVKSISYENARAAGLEQIVISMGSSHPDEIFALVAGELGTNLPATGVALASLTRQHGELVREKFSTLPPAVQEDAAESVAMAMVSDGGVSQELADWVNQLPPGKVFDRAATVYALNQVTRDISSAVLSAGQVGDTQARAELLSRLVEHADIDSAAEIPELLSRLDLEIGVRKTLEEQIAARTGDELAPLILPP